MKFIVAIGALAWAWNQGHVTWRYPVLLAGLWTTAAGFLVWAQPTWTLHGGWGLATVALFLPLARLGLAPLALAANRHR
jgi:hypothetical protein